MTFGFATNADCKLSVMTMLRLNRLPGTSLAMLTGVLLAGCMSAPPTADRTESFKLADPKESTLGRSLAESSENNPERSGHVVLDTGRQAYNARIALAGSAQLTLDAQYYIWNDDATGRILAEQLVVAANRGVRVRLLMDDYGVGDKDHQLSALDAHARIEVRAYNPFNAHFRSGLRRWANFAFGFARLNRRMHSKTFIVDNSIAITGGRNIGDEYFDANPTMNHHDRDMLSIGSVVGDISGQFDEMWNSEWSLPISALSDARFSSDKLAERYQQLQADTKVDRDRIYPLPLSQEARVALVQSFLDEAIWAPTRFVYNPPSITRGDEAGGAMVTGTLLELLSAARSEVLVESAYFTIMDDMLSRVSPYLESGLSIKVLTNSLATTDVWTIHAGYTRNREELLRRGVGLFEWRGDGRSCSTVIDNDMIECGNFKYSLHAKSVVFDRKIIFVGSFNLNPRSHLLNTETALVVESTELAQRIAADIALNMRPENSWKLGFDDDGDLRWYGTADGEPVIIDHEPQTSAMSRFKAGAAAVLPLEKYW